MVVCIIIIIIIIIATVIIIVRYGRSNDFLFISSIDGSINEADSLRPSLPHGNEIR
jgi:hypothetical protein